MEDRRKEIINYINFIYRKKKYKIPLVIITDSMIEYKKFWNLLFNERINFNIEEDILEFFKKENIQNDILNKSLEIEQILRKDIIENEKVIQLSRYTLETFDKEYLNFSTTKPLISNFFLCEKVCLVASIENNPTIKKHF